MLAYLSRYTHRVAIANSRLIALDDKGVTFKWKDYRIDGRGRFKSMTLATHEFIRRFLIHVLPRGFHRIRHYGLLDNGGRRNNLATIRRLLVPSDSTTSAICDEAQPNTEHAAAPPTFVCRHCGKPMLIVRLLEPDPAIRAPPQRVVA